MMSKYNLVRSTLISAIALAVWCGEMHSQPAMPVPQASPKAKVSQTVGISEVTIVYHRPSVKGRRIWGELVPFDEVWRAGANENTTISFSDPVKVEGKELPAGTYGLHMIPTQNSWTIIFSKNSSSWGSFFYNQNEDALRVSVQPQPAEIQEQLSYEFDGVKSDAATIALRWEKLSVPIQISFDTKGIVLATARNKFLCGPAGFGWQGFEQAAAYCLQNDVAPDEGLAWCDKSINLNENVTNVYTKAGLLDKLGKHAEAAAERARAMKLASSEADVNTLGYQLLGAGKKKEAIEIFQKNIKEHPSSWNVYDSYGEALDNVGETKEAVKQYSKALTMVQDDFNKKRITDVLKKLSAKGS